MDCNYYVEVLGHKTEYIYFYFLFIKLSINSGIGHG